MDLNQARLVSCIRKDEDRADWEKQKTTDRQYCQIPPCHYLREENERNDQLNVFKIPLLKSNLCWVSRKRNQEQEIAHFIVKPMTGIYIVGE